MASLDILGTTDIPARTSGRSLAPSGSVLVFLGIFAFLAAIPGPLLNDPDTQWHVTIGRSIAEARVLPWIDSWSHTFAGQPWIAKEWLAQLLMAAADALGGWAGVALLTAFAEAMTLALLYGWLALRIRPIVALAMTLAAFVLMAPHLVARPHVLVLPVTFLWACGLADAAGRREAPHWTLLLAMVAWANLHASFTFGFVIAGCFALDSVAGAEPDRRFRLASRWGVFLVLTLLSACATPYGHRSMLVTYSLVGKGESLPYMVEWQPVALDAFGGLVGILMAASLLVLLRHPATNFFRIVLVLFVSLFALRYIRFLDLYALVAPVALAEPIARLLGRSDIAATAHRVSTPGIAARTISALAFAAIVVLGLQGDPRPNPTMTPEAALKAARAEGLTEGRVYNDIDFGGYLIREGIKTFIDSRNDQIFLDGFTRTLNEAVVRRDGSSFLDLIDRAGVTWALVRAGSPDARQLARAAGWTSIYTDEIADVFVRRCEGSAGTACQTAR